MSEKKVVQIGEARVSVKNLRAIGEQNRLVEASNMRGRIKDAVRRVEAAREREREARRKRVVVDNFTKLREKQLKEEP